MGCFFVAMVLSGKDTRCNYFPNARVLNDLRNKPFLYDNEASRRLAEDWVDTIDVKNVLTYGDVDFDKSNVKEDGGKLYVIYGKTSKNKNINTKHHKCSKVCCYQYSFHTKITCQKISKNYTA